MKPSHPGDRGYQEPSGVYYREFDPYRFLRPSVFTVMGDSVPPSNPQTLILKHGMKDHTFQRGDMNDVALATGLGDDLITTRHGSPTSSHYQIPSPYLSASAYRQLWYNYDDYRRILDDLVESGVDEYVRYTAVKEIVNREPIEWLYYDYGPSGNYVRRFFKNASYPFDATGIILDGEEPVNGYYPELYPETGNSTWFRYVRLTDKDSRLLPYFQMHRLLRQFQYYFNEMLENPHITSFNPVFPGRYVDFPIMSGEHYGFTFASFNSDAFVNDFVDMKVSGIPIPQLDKATNLKLNNLNAKYEDWIDDNDYASGIIPRPSGSVFLLDMAQQVNWPLQYLRNMNCIVHVEAQQEPFSYTTNTTTEGTGYVLISGMLSHHDQFKAIHDFLGQPNYNRGQEDPSGREGTDSHSPGLPETWDYPQQYTNYAECNMDIFHSELHFSLIEPKDVTISWDIKATPKEFDINVIDRFGNVRSEPIRFRFVPSFSISLAMYSDCEWLLDKRSIDLGSTFDQLQIPEATGFVVDAKDGQIPNRGFIFQDGPCHNTVTIPKEFFTSGNYFHPNSFGFDNYNRIAYSTFQRQYDSISGFSSPNEPELNVLHYNTDETHNPFYLDVTAYPESNPGRPTTNLLPRFYVLQVYNNHCLVIDMQWRLEHLSGYIGRTNVYDFQLPNDLLVLDPSDFQITIDDIEIPVTKYDNIKVLDRNGNTADDRQITHGWYKVHHLNSRRPRTDRPFSSGFLGNATSQGLLGIDDWRASRTEAEFIEDFNNIEAGDRQGIVTPVHPASVNIFLSRRGSMPPIEDWRLNAVQLGMYEVTSESISTFNFGFGLTRYRTSARLIFKNSLGQVLLDDTLPSPFSSNDLCNLRSTTTTGIYEFNNIGGLFSDWQNVTVHLEVTDNFPTSSSNPTENCSSPMEELSLNYTFHGATLRFFVIRTRHLIHDDAPNNPNFTEIVSSGWVEIEVPELSTSTINGSGSASAPISVPSFLDSWWPAS